MNWYSQNDPRWQNNRLGLADGVTIGADGCYVTAMTNMANDCGHDIDVAALDQIFTDNAGGWGYVNSEGGADQADFCTDGMLSHVFSDIAYQDAKTYNDAADLTQLNNDVHVKQILEVDGQPQTPGLQTHFVYFYDYDPSTGVVRVVDSWTGFLISLADVYGDPATCIYKIVTYVWTPPAPAPTPAPPVDPVPVLPPLHTNTEPPVPADPVPPTPPVDPAPEVTPPVITTTLVPPADPSPVTPEVPVDKFITWLFYLIFFWVKKGQK